MRQGFLSHLIGITQTLLDGRHIHTATSFTACLQHNTIPPLHFFMPFSLHWQQIKIFLELWASEHWVYTDLWETGIWEASRSKPMEEIRSDLWARRGEEMRQARRGAWAWMEGKPAAARGHGRGLVGEFEVAEGFHRWNVYLTGENINPFYNPVKLQRVSMRFCKILTNMLRIYILF